MEIQKTLALFTALNMLLFMLFVACSQVTMTHSLKSSGKKIYISKHLIMNHTKTKKNRPTTLYWGHKKNVVPYLQSWGKKKKFGKAKHQTSLQVIVYQYNLTRVISVSMSNSVFCSNLTLFVPRLPGLTDS